MEQNKFDNSYYITRQNYNYIKNKDYETKLNFQLNIGWHSSNYG